jgi:tetratricopeptide (TPR) repeat protein
MRILFFLSFYFFIALPIFAQEKAKKANLDSLQKAYQSAKQDSNKIFTLIEIASAYVKANPDTCLSIAKETLAQSQQIKLQKGETNSLNLIASVYYRKNNYTLALEYYRKVLEYEALLIGRQRCNMLLNIGNIYLRQTNHAKAMEYYQRSLKISEQIKDNYVTAIMLNNIGNIHEAQREYNLALEYYKKSLAIKEEAKEKKGIAMSLNNIGIIYRYQKNYDLALKNYEKALQLQEELHDKQGISMALSNIGVIYKEQNKYDLALEFYQKALQLKESVKDTRGSLYPLNGISEIYQIKKDYDKSIEYAKKGIKIATEINALFELGMLSETIYKTYKLKKDYEQALNYYELYKKTQDSIFNIEKSKQIAELQTAFEVTEKEKEIMTLSKETQIQKLELKQRNWLLLGLSIFIVIFTFAAYIFYKNRQVIAKYNLLQTEQQVYRLQMNPHFFFNALVAIQDFVMQADGLKASSYISKFARLMRQTLEQSQQEFTSLSSEIETIKYYLDLQQLRFHGKFQYEITVDEDLEIDDIQIPIMLMQPVIENAIEHGLKESNQGKITISFSQKLNNISENLLQITISDNGIGRNKANQIDKNTINIPKKHNSMATKILASRVELLQKQANFNLEIETIDKSVEIHKESGTTVCFLMPLKYK